MEGSFICVKSAYTPSLEHINSYAAKHSQKYRFGDRRISTACH